MVVCHTTSSEGDIFRQRLWYPFASTRYFSSWRRWRGPLLVVLSLWLERWVHGGCFLCTAGDQRFKRNHQTRSVTNTSRSVSCARRSRGQRICSPSRTTLAVNCCQGLRKPKEPVPCFCFGLLATDRDNTERTKPQPVNAQGKTCMCGANLFLPPPWQQSHLHRHACAAVPSSCLLLIRKYSESST